MATMKAGPCGGNGGAEKNMDVTGITRIVKITIRGTVCIECITVRFLRNGVEETTDQWGGLAPQRGKVEEITFNPNERITSVSGYVGPFHNQFIVMSLKIQTNLNGQVKTYGPFGAQQGTPFELPALGGEVIGFHGRGAGLIDALGIYVKATSTTNGGTPGTWPQSNTMKEFYFHLFYYEIIKGENKTTVSVTNPDSFGEIRVMDVPLYDSLNKTKLLARAQGSSKQSALDELAWHLSFDIVFEMPELKGSTLQVMGRTSEEANNLREWAIVGGTGQFTMARGVIYGVRRSAPELEKANLIELKIHGYHTPMKQPTWN